MVWFVNIYKGEKEVKNKKRLKKKTLEKKKKNEKRKATKKSKVKKNKKALIKKILFTGTSRVPELYFKTVLLKLLEI